MPDFHRRPNLVGAPHRQQPSMAVADIVSDRDIDALTSYGDVVVMEGGVNTAGNLMIVNEQGAVVSLPFPRWPEVLADVLNVDVAATTIAGQDVMGSLAVCNAHGVLLHPDIRRG